MSAIPEKDGELGHKLVADMTRLTWERHGPMALDNAAANRSLLDRGRSLAALRDARVGAGDSAIVIAAGPSLRRQDPAKAIREAAYRGAIIATESALTYCLSEGLVPDLVVTVDPHPTRIVRWLGDPALTPDRLAEDDYFARQEQDPAFADELSANQRILGLMDRHGRDLRMALATSASRELVDRILQVGMDVYWWNPMLDDPDQPESVTAALQRDNGLPCVNAGGNVGTTCWMMAHAVLGKRHVALTGVDFSYYADTPYANTQYYREAVDLVGEENLDAVYMRLHNPHLGAWFYTDPAYMWYRQALLELVGDADCTTYNCSEGGIVFGDGIEFMPLFRFLDRFASTTDPAPLLGAATTSLR